VEAKMVDVVVETLRVGDLEDKVDVQMPDHSKVEGIIKHIESGRYSTTGIILLKGMEQPVPCGFHDYNGWFTLKD
jgi:hypothetical protein